MGNPIDSAQFVRLLDSRLREVGEDTYKSLDSKIPVLFNMLDSDSAWEEYYDISGVEDIPEFNGKLSYLPVYPGFHKKIEHKEFAAGMQIERKLLDDKKYGVLDGRAAMLMKAAQRTREKIAAGAFNYAFNTQFEFMESEEGVALCSDSHTTKTGTSTTSGFDNLATAALSKTTLATVRLQLRKLRDDNAELIDTSENLILLVPEALQQTAEEILWTTKGLDTEYGTVNVHNRRNFKLVPWLRLDDYDTTNWFLIDAERMKRENLFQDRIAPEISTTRDFDTYMLKTAVYFRCSYGHIGWRWLVGNQVA